MKTYLKPEAEIVELKFDEIVMGSINSGEWGVEDGEGGGWED